MSHSGEGHQTPVTGFGARLAAAVSSHGPLCLGIDPHPELLAAWDLPADPYGLARFCDICVAAFGGFAVVKPQVAFFEAYGAAGYAVLERTIAALRQAGVLVLADAKRGDIGSTMAAYAAAWAGDSPLAADAVTASPYLGFGSLCPLLRTAAEHGRGVFVLAATSNPEAAAVQRALADGRTVAQSIVDAAAAVNREARPEPGSAGAPEPGSAGVPEPGSAGVPEPGSAGVLVPGSAGVPEPGSTRVPELGSVGVVIGATVADAPDVGLLGGPVLVPGVGAQGGRPEALGGLGGARPGQLLPAVSRAVLVAGPDVTALRAAAERLRDAVAYLA